MSEYSCRRCGKGLGDPGWCSVCDKKLNPPPSEVAEKCPDCKHDWFTHETGMCKSFRRGSGECGCTTPKPLPTETVKVLTGNCYDCRDTPVYDGKSYCDSCAGKRYKASMAELAADSPTETEKKVVVACSYCGEDFDMSPDADVHDCQKKTAQPHAVKSIWECSKCGKKWLDGDDDNHDCSPTTLLSESEWRRARVIELIVRCMRHAEHCGDCKHPELDMLEEALRHLTEVE